MPDTIENVNPVKYQRFKELKKQSFLLTGITGFAGAHLAQLLYENGHKVYGLIRGSNGMETDILDTVSQECFDSITFLYGNLEDIDSLRDIFEKYLFDGVFHLAAQSHPPTSLLYPIDTYRTNVMGSINLFDTIEKLQSASCKVMACSTSEVYGNSGQSGRLLKETDPLVPSNPYASSKAAMDLYLQERMANGKIKGFITRAFSHTGIRRGKNFSISADAYQIAQQLKKVIPAKVDSQEFKIDVGNLETTRVVIDVKDVVMAYYMLMLNPDSNGKVFNVCGDVPRKMEYFTDKLIELSKLNIKKEVSPKYYRPIDIYYQHGDTTALKELTGWEPKIPIETTLWDLLLYWIKKLA